MNNVTNVAFVQLFFVLRKECVSSIMSEVHLPHAVVLTLRGAAVLRTQSSKTRKWYT